MTRLRWTNERIDFTDHARGFATDGPGVYDIEDEVAERYLSHRSGGWERVDDGSETEETSEEDTPEETEGYTRDELEEMDYSELSELASESDDESIHGRSSTEEIIETLADD